MAEDETRECGCDAHEEEQELLVGHLQKSNQRLTEARNKFLVESKEFEFIGDLGVYYIRAKFWCKPGQGFDDLAKREFGWPSAYLGGESQSVNAAMWFKTVEGTFDLAGIWVFSRSGDETSMYTKEKYIQDVYNLAEDGSAITDPLCHDSLSASSDIQECEDFNCVTLIEYPTAEEVAAATATAEDVVEPAVVTAKTNSGTNKQKKQRVVERPVAEDVDLTAYFPKG